MTRHRAELN